VPFANAPAPELTVVMTIGDAVVPVARFFQLVPAFVVYW